MDLEPARIVQNEDLTLKLLRSQENWELLKESMSLDVCNSIPHSNYLTSEINPQRKDQG